MSWNVNGPTAEIRETYSCVIDCPTDYVESDGPFVDTARMTMTFKYIKGSGNGSYDWNLGVTKLDDNENDAWEFVIHTSDDNGRTYKVAHRKKPVMMSTSGGGGGSVALPGRKKKKSWWKRFFS